MLKKTARPRRAVAAVCAVCAVCAAALCLAGSGAVRRRAQRSAASPAAAAADPAPARHTAFLTACGWTVRPGPAAVETVRIPETFGAVYQRYNRLQRAQGCDLAPYRGRAVRKYVYEILAYPDGAPAEDLRANVLEADGRIIGGDISSVRVDGCMLGFHGETDGYDTTG